jgi:hypothetical protein
MARVSRVSAVFVLCVSNYLARWEVLEQEPAQASRLSIINVSQLHWEAFV